MLNFGVVLKDDEAKSNLGGSSGDDDEGVSIFHDVVLDRKGVYERLLQEKSPHARQGKIERVLIASALLCLELSIQHLNAGAVPCWGVQSAKNSQIISDAAYASSAKSLEELERQFRILGAENAQVDLYALRNDFFPITAYSQTAVGATPKPKRDPHTDAEPTNRKSERSRKTNPCYAAIDKALCDVAASRPRGQVEVFKSLDQRKVPVPHAEPFTNFGWFKGFERNKPLARIWLSRRWALLKLPGFRRFPK